MTITFILLALCTGCSLFPRAIRPTNLWKLNGQPPGGTESMYFSIPDPPAPNPAESD